MHAAKPRQGRLYTNERRTTGITAGLLLLMGSALGCVAPDFEASIASNSVKADESNGSGCDASIHRGTVCLKAEVADTGIIPTAIQVLEASDGSVHLLYEAQAPEERGRFGELRHTMRAPNGAWAAPVVVDRIDISESDRTMGALMTRSGQIVVAYSPDGRDPNVPSDVLAYRWFEEGVWSDAKYIDGRFSRELPQYPTFVETESGRIALLVWWGPEQSPYLRLFAFEQLAAPPIEQPVADEMMVMGANGQSVGMTGPTFVEEPTGLVDQNGDLRVFGFLPAQHLGGLYSFALDAEALDQPADRHPWYAAQSLLRGNAQHGRRANAALYEDRLLIAHAQWNGGGIHLTEAKPGTAYEGDPAALADVRTTLVDNRNENVWAPAIAVDDVGRVNIVYTDSSEETHDVYHAVMQEDGPGEWRTTIEALPDVYVSDRHGVYPAIAKSSRGGVYVAAPEHGSASLVVFTLR